MRSPLKKRKQEKSSGQNAGEPDVRQMSRDHRLMGLRPPEERSLTEAQEMEAQSDCPKQCRFYETLSKAQVQQVGR